MHHRFILSHMQRSYIIIFISLVARMCFYSVRNGPDFSKNTILVLVMYVELFIHLCKIG